MSSSSSTPKQPAFGAGCHQMPYPMMGLAARETGSSNILLSCGGGGSNNRKEIPNEIQLHLYNQDLGKLVTVDARNLGGVLPTSATWSKAQDLFTVSAGPKGYVIEIVGEGENSKMEILHEFTSEWIIQKGEDERGGDPSQEKCV